jgi:hypothetical protein
VRKMARPSTLQDIHHIDQQGWPMCEAISRD